VPILALAVLFFAWQGATPGRCAWRGALFGLGLFGVGVSWVQVSIHEFGLPVLAVSVSLTAGFVLFMSAYPLLAGWLAARLGRGVSRVAALLGLWPAVWVLSEWLRGSLFRGFPWLLTGYSQIDGPLAGLAPVAGAYGVGLAAAICAGGAVLAAGGGARARLTGGIAIVALLALGAALGRVSWTDPSGARLRIALIQGAVPQAIKWRPAERERTLGAYLSLTEPYWGADLIVWPETAIPAFPSEVAEYLEALDRRARAEGTAVLIGMPVPSADRKRYYNGVLALGRGRGVYHKRHLVPFGEYLPFRPVLDGVLEWLRLPVSSFSPGDAEQPPITAADLRVGVSVCYESAYSGEIRRALPQAQLLVNVSNDAWFGDSLAPAQHLEIARMRALEAGRYLLRATNTGISAVIDPRGEVLARSPQFEPYALAAQVEGRGGTTFYARFGDLPLMLVMLVIALASLGAGRTTPAPP
jgi:apolipoprotein N-acyltransferase